MSRVLYECYMNLLYELIPAQKVCRIPLPARDGSQLFLEESPSQIKRRPSGPLD